MKINNGKPHSNRVKKPLRGSSHAGTISSRFTDFSRKKLTLLHQQEERRFFSLPSNIPANEKSAHSANEKPTQPGVSSPPINLSSKQLL